MTRRKVDESTSTITTIGEFLAAGLVCKVISVHRAKDEKISIQTMIERGKNDAYMRMVDATFLINNKRFIPAEYFTKVFIFPLWINAEDDEDTAKDGLVRIIEHDAGWWCLTARPNTDNYGQNYVLVSYDAPKH